MARPKKLDVKNNLNEIAQGLAGCGLAPTNEAALETLNGAAKTLSAKLEGVQIFDVTFGEAEALSLAKFAAVAAISRKQQANAREVNILKTLSASHLPEFIPVAKDGQEVWVSRSMLREAIRTTATGIRGMLPTSHTQDDAIAGEANGFAPWGSLKVGDILARYQVPKPIVGKEAKASKKSK